MIGPKNAYSPTRKAYDRRELMKETIFLPQNSFKINLSVAEVLQLSTYSENTERKFTTLSEANNMVTRYKAY